MGAEMPRDAQPRKPFPLCIRYQYIDVPGTRYVSFVAVRII